MANPWFRLYAEFAHDPKFRSLSENAIVVAEIAHMAALEKSTCYPNWREVESHSLITSDEFMAAFNELCDAGIVFSGFPSLLVFLADEYPLAPMFGPMKRSRPSADVWMVIRRRIFERDGFTCTYCGAKGVRLECDHIFPVSRGGGHDDSNLTTACMMCNRSKRDKTLDEWGL